MSQEGAPRILLVDDDPNHNLAVTKVLQGVGYQVRGTGDSQGAIALLQEQDFELVILDFRMPGIGGLDLLRTIRRQWGDTPVVILTAHGEWTSYMEAMNAGAADYLTKPVRRADIHATVRKVLARYGIRAPGVPVSDSERLEGGAI